jgi:hypothetical protein
MDCNDGAAIVFFSKDGNTRTGARLLNGGVNGTIIELKEMKKGNFVQALLKKESRLIGEPWLKISDVKYVYLMLPIWAGNGVPAMNSFITHADFTGKEVCVITFQQFADLRNSDKVHKYISDIVSGENGLVKEQYALIGGKMGHCADEKLIKEQIDKVRILTSIS